MNIFPPMLIHGLEAKISGLDFVYVASLALLQWH